MVSQVSSIGLYDSPWAVINQLILNLVHVCIQLLVACTPLQDFLHMLVNTIKHYIYPAFTK